MPVTAYLSLMKGEWLQKSFHDIITRQHCWQAKIQIKETNHKMADSAFID